ncbi:N-6 DNA methylase [bacterium]|nr:N-6 DNA methylase [bacterium]
MNKIKINERSWAIDVITEINQYLSNKSWVIAMAGGENSLSFEKRTLFPDLLLFKDNNKSSILHGWELKMPDTSIDDLEFINNATLKANILNRNSFILWNVKSCKLYNKEGNIFVERKSWRIDSIHDRYDVECHVHLWKKLLHEILEYLNMFFSNANHNKQLVSLFSIEKIFDVVLSNSLETKLSISKEIRKNSILEAEINHWWSDTSYEYGFSFGEDDEKLNILSKIVLTDWIIKIIFANIIKRYFNVALIIEKIKETTEKSQAIDYFSYISLNCNFWNIFRPHIGQSLIDDESWFEIKQLNSFFSSINIQGIDIQIIQSFFEESLQYSKRRIAGQFTTPEIIAELIVRLTLNDKESSVMDPCCGTGTIVKKVMEIKQEYNINNQEIINNIWASDKYFFPIQLSTLSLTNLDQYGQIMNIHCSDVFDLYAGLIIEFRNPFDGEIVKKEVPKIGAIISNLPFINNGDIDYENSNISEIEIYIKNHIHRPYRFNRRSDFYIYIIFSIHKLLQDSGRIGLILSNAWLGTDYGSQFIELFQLFYDIDKLIISGSKRWFGNADIVTCILIATKKNNNTNSGFISFCTLLKPIETYLSLKDLSEKILLNKSSNEIRIIRRSKDNLEFLENNGFSWSSFFVNIEWFNEIQKNLIYAHELFDIYRGERRGWNDLFYPTNEPNIEKDYLLPLVKNLRTTKGLICNPNSFAFCCDLSIKELRKKGHTKTLSWINRFSKMTNSKNKPLPEVLKTKQHDWYQMDSDNVADFVMNINFADSLFVAYLEQKSIIDQRVIGFKSKTKLSHKSKLVILALFNSVISMFFIESLGFGRGLGALDLSSTKIKNNFRMLNPSCLTTKQQDTILSHFNKILVRDRKPLLEEIESPDRLQFEMEIMKAFNIDKSVYKSIVNDLKSLYQIRVNLE